MGLSICRSIIDVHGGRLWAEANEPRGAVFQFTLPNAEKKLMKAHQNGEPYEGTVLDVFRGGAFLMWSRMRSMMSRVRSVSPTTEPSASRTSPRSGGCRSRKLQAARALLRALAIGCAISCASEAVSSPIMLKRFMWARSDSSWRSLSCSFCARFRSVTSTCVLTASTSAPLKENS
jgi:hypothetical protein